MSPENMSTQASLTVVVPCYNCGAVVGRAVGSILRQTLLPDEIIFIDDCSVDNTLDVLKSMSFAASVRVKIISLNKNSGPARARNVGIDMASNDLIAFLDADDSWHPKKIEIQYQLMIDAPDVVLSGHAIALHASDGESAVPSESCVREIKFWQLLFKNFFNTPSVLIRRSNLRFVDCMRYAEDYNFWLDISNSGGRLVFVDSVLGFVHKPFYGHSGLSQNIRGMHDAELHALRKFSINKHVRPWVVKIAILFAKFKYILRLARVLL